MTLARCRSRASHRGSSYRRGGVLACPLTVRALVAAGVSCTALLAPTSARAQRLGEAPVAPASAIGPATSAATWSVMGMASASDASGTPLMQRSDMWLGATQPLGHVGRVRFSAIGSGTVRMRAAAEGDDAGGAQLALRARARLGGVQVWSAVSYGMASLSAPGAGPVMGFRFPIAPAADAPRIDTTISRQVDVGSMQRAEAGMLTTVGPFDVSVGMAMDRATRVTTQTMSINEVGGTARAVALRTTRAMQRREMATAIAALGFATGATDWLVSVTAPVASWTVGDALASATPRTPAIASVAVVQPVTEWLSVVGAASSRSSSVGASVLHDDVTAGRARTFAPVVAIGVRLARLPFLSRGDDVPMGILAFETRTVGAVDLTPATDSGTEDAVDGYAIRVRDASRDTLRVVLFVDAPKAETIELMGDATQWTVTKLRRTPSGRWRTELRLAPGVHRLAVRADGGRWMAPPSLPIGNDDYGTPVGMIVVRGPR